jgi:ABC-type uncharacterized transport system involved in gliding motility auxiliary subunit
MIGAALGSKTRARLALVLLAVLFAAVNVTAQTAFRGVHVDVTEDGLYSVSDGTRSVLESIGEPIRLRLYYTPALGEAAPDFAAYHRRVRTLLEQYADIAGDGLILAYPNPEPFSDTEDRAVAFGLQGIALNETGDQGYFGIAATNSTDDKEVIPFLGLEREALLEYDLTKMIAALARPEKPHVGVISSLPVMGGPPRVPGAPPDPKWALIDAIEPFYRVRNLGTGIEMIDEKIGILIVVHPIGLSDATLYAIDQFVLRGGRAIVFVDPLPEVARLSPGPLGPRRPQASQFDRLLNAWGLEMAPGTVAADLDAARRINLGQGAAQQSADYVAWLALGPENGTADDPVAGAFTTLNLATAGVLTPIEGAKTTITPLLRTGENSMRLTTEQVDPQPDVLGLFRGFEPSGERLMLAARITGPNRTAFPDGPPADWEPDFGEEAPAHLPTARGSLNIVVIADADMTHEIMWGRRQNLLGQEVVVPIADNANLIVNALDNLAGSDALAGLRARTVQRRPFTRVETIRREAERTYLDREQALLDELTGLRARLQDLARREGAADVAVSAEESQALADARARLIETRRELRAVQRALRADIDRLETTVKAVNILAAPLALTLIGLGVAAVGRARRARAIRTS